jgi:hypothetical protein
MRGGRSVVVACALLFWSAGPLAGTSLRDLLARLPVLEGTVPIFYAGGTRDQAVRVQPLVAGAAEFYSTKTGVALSVEVGLIGPVEWHSFPHPGPTPTPYNQFITSVAPGSRYIISIPTGGGHALDPLVQQLTRDSEQVRGLGLSAEELSQRFTSLTALHEIGHFYVENAVPSAPAWLIEFVASYLTTAFLIEHHAEDARIWRTVSLTSAKYVRPKPHVSGDFHIALLANNYLVYLGRLQARVDDVYRRHGAAFLEKFSDAPAAMRLIAHASPGFEAWVGQHHRER